MAGQHRLDHLVDVFPERIGALNAAALVLDTAALSNHRQFFLHLCQGFIELLLGLQGLDVLMHDHQALHLVDVRVWRHGDLLNDLQDGHRLGGDHRGVGLFDPGYLAHGDLSRK
ncbi:hypothetical protein D3C77_133720 [compost metagenome]